MTKKYPLHPFFEEAPSLDRPCAHENCPLKGEFKAPRSQKDLRNYLWFCLSHVRLYNEKWNYYEGMDSFDIDREQRWDETWQRPTWPFTQRVAMNATVERMAKDFAKAKDFFQAQDDEDIDMRSKPRFAVNSPENQALICMDMTYPYTQKQLKGRYLTLAKTYHPDINKGSREAEERLKKINLAYELLKNLIS